MDSSTIMEINKKIKVIRKFIRELIKKHKVQHSQVNIYRNNIKKL
jgi:hypothetical protein